MNWIRLTFSFIILPISLLSHATVQEVINTNDSGPGSLREATINAGINAGPDTIIFNIPLTDPGFDSTTGVWTIVAMTTFQVPAGTVIDGGKAIGSDQRPGVEIEGAANAIILGMTGIRAGDSVSIRGLTVNQFQYGIWIQASGVIIEQCYLGTDPTGNIAKPNGINGILVANGGTQALIQNNLISGNNGGGIRLFGAETFGNVIRNNLIGTNLDGTASLPNNGDGIRLHARANGNIIQNNLISGNNFSGVSLVDTGTNDNVLEDNFIGTDIDGVSSIPNGRYGIVFFDGSMNNVCGPGNLVAFNNQDGILVDGADSNETIGNRITVNSIYRNGGSGIFNTRGGNSEISPPIIDSLIEQVVYGTANPGQMIELFADHFDEGCCYLATDTTNSTGNFSIALPDTSDQPYLTTTSTDSTGNTSAFSQPFSIIDPCGDDSLPKPMIMGLTSFCPDQSTDLNAGSFTGYLWSTGDTTQIISVAETGNYSVTVTDSSGCTGSDSVTVNALSAPSVSIAGTLSFCPGSGTDLDAGNFERYLWSTGDTTQLVSVDHEGTLSVTVTDINGCTGKDSVMVMEWLTPLVSIRGTISDCATTELDAGSFDSYLWSTGDTTQTINVVSIGTYSVTVTDQNGCTASDALGVKEDPLSLPWIQNLINNPFNPYCNECLTTSYAKWGMEEVIIFDWDAASCAFTDLGFTTVYNCLGDTIQFCYSSIAGLHCEPDSMIGSEHLQDEQLLWQCTPISLPKCPTESDSILQMTWLMDTLQQYDAFCHALCTGGNHGNFLYTHVLDTNLIIELRTTCADVVRRFYDCQGTRIYSCISFSESQEINCDLGFIPTDNSGELIWQCPATTGHTSLEESDAFSLFPTLVSDHLTIRTEQAKPWKLIISDGFGHTLLERTGHSQGEVINTFAWPPGVLYARIKTRNNIQQFKVVKIK